jgi:23S rRNA pseudouridine2605 synthase
MNTEGLIILTNDGRLAHLLDAPEFGHCQGVPGTGGGRSVTRRRSAGLREGVELDDGMTSPAQVSRVSEGLLRIVIHEGRNRQVRRMCTAIGHDVTAWCARALDHSRTPR